MTDKLIDKLELEFNAIHDHCPICGGNLIEDRHNDADWGTWCEKCNWSRHYCKAVINECLLGKYDIIFWKKMKKDRCLICSASNKFGADCNPCIYE